LLFDPNPAAPPISPNEEAARAALQQGSDRRTITRPDGVRVRLLTYRLTRDDGPALLQLGRTLADQERVLAQLTGVMLGLGLASAAALGAGSWWLAGRAIGPAQEAWNRQRAFIANASHELRTPLTLLRASAEVALRGLPPTERDQRELLDDIVQESDHMTRLVDDLLLLSRLDAGRLELNCERLAVDEVLCEVVREVDRLAQERGISLKCRPGGGVVTADRTRLRQVLLVLLDNALRHTTAGGGSIELRSEMGGRTVAIAVQDTGSGIAPEHLSQLFTRFYRVDSARSGDGGAGLGLSIAQALIEAQGGRISVESAVGQGSTFTIVLPQQV
jgi:signal transduction histidine kinase